ncbi:beta-lactamase-like protein [Novosphingobium aromaticivorans DSM 12444]|uniref:Beta-lactamase-like protein n=1 Tax=Novosphingobium aromaticivorans (strain ATCC 700278 / DSM 12444 / CCUG 56034 / CIP 105152 / NBRC 16084 / F199) TaxID=279238 RepID=Q2G5I0_NOVAD|nr:MBL fold metallo-hydrolase [Novosphingobium aromaticivorans]ABD26893.1 beta-lactamase-like protein [Novosphingobium aromaticivorans DSM 12444]SCY44807.1 Glyoxylase, beta-lactamase superfamily II [Novosphingobium aromaticivorans]
MDRFDLGIVKVHRIEEWRGTFSPPAELFDGFSPDGWEPHAEEFAPEYYDPVSGKLFAFLQSWVLDTGTQRILFDTGAGNDKDRPNLPIFGNLQTGFLDNLAAAGFQPEDIDVVVCSHIHVDHVGWNTRLVDGRWEPTFRNARYVLPLADRAYWDPQDASAGPAGIGAAVNAGMFDDSVRPIIEAGRAEWAEDGFEVAEGLVLRSCPGHTPGSMMLEVSGGEDTAMFVGDVVHHPAQIYRPEWNSIFCEAPEDARETRRRVLDLAASREALLIPAHFGGSHMARVLRDGSGFRPVLDPMGSG